MRWEIWQGRFVRQGGRALFLVKPHEHWPTKEHKNTAFRHGVIPACPHTGGFAEENRESLCPLFGKEGLGEILWKIIYSKNPPLSPFAKGGRYGKKDAGQAGMTT